MGMWANSMDFNMSSASLCCTLANIMANLDKKPILRLRTKPGKSKKNEDALLLNVGGRLSYDLYVTLLLLILLHCLCCLTSIKGDQSKKKKVPKKKKKKKKKKK